MVSTSGPAPRPTLAVQILASRPQQPPSGPALIAGLRRTLEPLVPNAQGLIDGFGQVAAAERRARGEQFSLRDHVRGLVLSLLSNQRPWMPIARQMDAIAHVMLGFEPDALLVASPEGLVAGLRALRAGNRGIAMQMRTLGENIELLRRIEREHESLDAFVSGAPPAEVARRLAMPGPWKLKCVGFALAAEYLRNVGVSMTKPDVHVLRILGHERLGYFERGASDEHVVRVVGELASAAGVTATELDTLVWMLGAKGCGEVCGAQPRCELCCLREQCRRGSSSIEPQ